MAPQRRSRPRTADAAPDVRAVWHDYTARSYRCVGSWYASRDVTVPHLLGSRRLGEFDSIPSLHNTIAHKQRDTRRPHSQGSPTRSESSPGKLPSQPTGMSPGAGVDGANDDGSNDDGGSGTSVGASGSPDATFTMSLADKLAEQASNIIRTIHQALANNRRLYGQTLKDVHGVFAAFDKDGSGTLDMAELEQALHRLGCGLTQDQVSQLMLVLDADKSGTLEVDEFVQALQAYGGHSRKQLTPAQQARKRFEAEQEAAQLAAAQQQAAAERAAREEAAKAGEAARLDTEARIAARRKQREEIEAARAAEQLVEQARKAKLSAAREKRRLADKDRRAHLDAARAAAKRAAAAAERAANEELWAEGKRLREEKLAEAVAQARWQQQSHAAGSAAARRRQSAKLQMHRMEREQCKHEWEEERQQQWTANASAKARGASRALQAYLDRSVRLAEEQAERLARASEFGATATLDGHSAASSIAADGPSY